MNYLIQTCFLIFSILIIYGCGGDSKEETAYSLDHIIEMRLNDDQSINGQIVKISNEIKTYFGVACTADILPPCVPYSEIEKEDLSSYQSMNEYGHYNNQDWCPNDDIRLVSKYNSQYEKLTIDHLDFKDFSNHEKDGPYDVEFFAEINFIEPIDYCEKKIYKGVEIILLEGEENSLKDQILNQN